MLCQGYLVVAGVVGTRMASVAVVVIVVLVLHYPMVVCFWAFFEGLDVGKEPVKFVVEVGHQHLHEDSVVVHRSGNCRGCQHHDDIVGLCNDLWGDVFE